MSLENFSERECAGCGKLATVRTSEGHDVAYCHECLYVFKTAAIRALSQRNYELVLKLFMDTVLPWLGGKPMEKIE